MRARTSFFLLATLGCSSTPWKPLDPSVLKGVPARTIGAQSAKPASFQLYAPHSGGLAMVLVAISEGERTVRENNLADPALTITDGLAKALAVQHGLVAAGPKVVYHGDIRVWDTDFVLEVATSKWSLEYFPTTWRHYRLLYHATVELKDVRRNRVVATGKCLVPTPRDPDREPSYDQFMYSKASILRQKLDAAATYCARMFGRELFGLTLPADWKPEPPPTPRAGDVPTACRLEGTPAWDAADVEGKRRLLFECLEKERVRPAPAAAPPPARPSSEPSIAP